MPAPLPKPIRDRIVEAHDNGEGTYEELAERFKVGVASVDRYLALARKTGTTAPKPMGGHRKPRKVTPEGEDWLRALVKEQPSLSLPEMSALYEAEFGVEVASRLLGKVMKRLGITKKKRDGGPGRRSVLMWSSAEKSG